MTEFGIFTNPYVRGTLLTKDDVKYHLGITMRITLKYVKLYQKERYATFQEALSHQDRKTKLPLPVSRLSENFNVEHVKLDEDILIGHVFQDLENLKNEDKWIDMLTQGMMCLSSTILMYSDKRHNQAAGNIKETSREQELFAYLLTAMLNPPFFVRLQCTVKFDDVIGMQKTLPSATFDLVSTKMVSGEIHRSNFTSLVSLQGGNEVEVQEMVVEALSSMTDASINKTASKVQVAFESLVFSELHPNHAVPIICASKSHVQFYIRVKATDVYTPLQKWCDVEQGKVILNYPVCIAFILFIKEASCSEVYPEFDVPFLDTLTENLSPIGWNQAYANSRIKYHRELAQAVHAVKQVSSLSKDLKLSEQYIPKATILGKHVRQESSDSSTSSQMQ